jgi:hypothetical protein
MHDDKYDLIGMSDDEMVEQDCDLFNKTTPIGHPVVYYPILNRFGLVVRKNSMRTHVKSKAWVENQLPIVSLEDIGEVSIYHVRNGLCVNTQQDQFDQNYNHKW